MCLSVEVLANFKIVIVGHVGALVLYLAGGECKSQTLTQ